MKVGRFDHVMQIAAQATMFGRALAAEHLSYSVACKHHHLLRGLGCGASLAELQQECLDDRRMCGCEKQVQATLHQGL